MSPSPNDLLEKEEASQGKSPLKEFRDFVMKHRILILLVIHAVLFVGIHWAAYLIRFHPGMTDLQFNLFRNGIVPVVGIKVGVFMWLRSFHGWWRHVSFSDFISLLKAAVVATLAIAAADYFVLHKQIPRTVLAGDLALTIVIIGGLRSVWRVWDERIAPLDRSKKIARALLIGHGFESAKLAHLINGQHELGVRIVGLVSPKKGKKGTRFSDLRVVGGIDSLPALMSQHQAKTVFMTTGSVPAKQLRALLDEASGEDFEIKILPQLSEQLRGMDKLPIREVAFDDLLRRKPVNLDIGSIARIVKGKTVLVTGAGGSIGSELCRQLSRFAPARIVLLGRGENRIYHIERELKGMTDLVKFIPRIATITDQRRMEEIFESLRPDLVFHAAAHKHVPLVESNVGESIVNNIKGTKVVADLADKYNVERFVMVSTDKSVNPTSMMGATKQIAERYCQSLAATSKTKFISTRFGNVLGSAGSVVPLFQEQIRRGGPVTVTDPRMTRYFMTIPEASQLVIQAASMGEGGEIFVLEMGQPVRIVDLAKDLIRLAGHPPGSIDIVFSGVRPGEKLFEELYYENEQSTPTKHDQILSSHSRSFPDGEVASQVERLIAAAYQPHDSIRKLMKEIVPEYHEPNLGTKSERVDPSAAGVAGAHLPAVTKENSKQQL